MKLDRRGFLAGVGLVVAAPAIVRADALMVMPRRPWPPFLLRADGRLVCNGALLRVSDFPELFSVMGNSHGGTPGLDFRLPYLPCGDLKFLVNAAPGPSGPTGMLMLST